VFSKDKRKHSTLNSLAYFLRKKSVRKVHIRIDFWNSDTYYTMQDC